MKVSAITFCLIGAAAGPALADAAPVPLQRFTVQCAPRGPACVTIDRAQGTVTVTRGRTGPAFWRARAKPASATVSNDGRFVFEEYREGGVIGLTDGPDTLLMIVRDHGRVTRELRVRDIAARPTDLPRTTSHRNWSIIRFFGPANRVMIDLPDGRTLAIDPVSGAVAAQPPRTDGRPGYCRSAGHPIQGPCAKR